MTLTEFVVVAIDPPPRPVTRAAAVKDYLILAGGDIAPPERDLAERWGVSAATAHRWRKHALTAPVRVVWGGGHE